MERLKHLILTVLGAAIAWVVLFQLVYWIGSFFSMTARVAAIIVSVLVGISLVLSITEISG